MYVEALSLFTAFCYGASAVLTRKGMRDSNPVTGVLVTTVVQVVMISGLLMSAPPKSMNMVGIAFFVASGILASTLGRFFNYTSIESLGVPVSATIIGSSPLFSTAFAIVFIGENVALATLLGTLLIVSGIALTREGGDKGPRLTSAILLPVASAAFYGASSVVRKVGLNLLPEATLGALVGASSSLLSFALYLTATGRLADVRLSRNSVKYFLASGVVISLGWVCMFNALSVGDVSVVSALIGANPLFSLALSLLLLRDVEEFGWRVAAGCLAIVAGAAAITLL